jgi:hypothetical protein
MNIPYKNSASMIPGALPPMSEARKNEIILESLKKDFDLRGENLEIVKKSLDILDRADNVMTLAEICGLLTEGSALAAAGTAVSLLNVFLFPVGAAIEFVNAWQFGEKLVGLRAVAYATTAWAFGDPVPRFPAQIRANVIHDRGRNLQPVLFRESAWNNASASAVKSLEETCRTKRIQKKSYQTLFKAAGDSNRNSLVRKLMKGLENRVDPGWQRQAFWSPLPNYPH